MAKERKAQTKEIETDNYGGGGTTGTSTGAKGVVAWDKSQRASGAKNHVKPAPQDESHAPRRKTIEKLKFPSYCLGDLSAVRPFQHSHARQIVPGD